MTTGTGNTTTGPVATSYPEADVSPQTILVSTPMCAHAHPTLGVTCALMTGHDGDHWGYQAPVIWEAQ